MDFTPHIPSDIHGNFSNELIKKSEDVIIQSAKLTGNIAPEILLEVKNILRTVNSYYSNRIESEGTGILGIDKALNKEYSTDTKEKKLQILAVRHIQTQEFIESYINTHDICVYATNFIKLIHKEFYSKEGMQVFLDIKDKDLQVKMIPGQIREENVFIGMHHAPASSKISGMLNDYSNLYEQSRHKPLAHKLIYILSSHHRFVWIHPFLDGNGRVSRLLLDAAFLAQNIEGYGIWNLSRGLARTVETYKSSLKYADTLQLNQKDGKGYLSAQALEKFVHYMLDTALDQITYMSEVLRLDTLTQRIENFVTLLDANMYHEKPLPKYSLLIFKHLLLYGSMERGKAGQIIGKGLRTGSGLLSSLEKRGYLTSDSPKGKVRIKFNVFFCSTHLS
ncbi:Fic family protein [Sulfurimonas sp. MAG313]|nr:Fic family protein [Sulfurimonas sp. MAG313]MDF1880600.1 Fic family protein [Sulfurimonas sp. MAG313]